MLVRFAPDHTLAALAKVHPRAQFNSGEPEVDTWLATKALQHQKKHLSTTKVLLDATGSIAGYYTLATGQVDFGDLPPDLTRKLPRRALPVAMLAWLGVDSSRQGEGLGRRLFAQALADCYRAGEVFAFIAVILDCLNDRAKDFYSQWDFRELPGNPYRLYVSAAHLAALISVSKAA